MGLDPVLWSRMQFGFTASFHILFPSVTIGLSVWLFILEAMSQSTGKAVYRRLFGLWLKVFTLLFALGVVSGLVMAFQFGTNWSELSARGGAVMGPLLGYEALSAFALEAAFLGIVLYGRSRVSPHMYLLACGMVMLGTIVSSFWIMCNNSWMQVPTGYAIVNGRIIPGDWKAIVLGPVFLMRWVHMLLATFLTTSMGLTGVGAWYLLRTKHLEEGRTMLKFGLMVSVVLAVLQLLSGDLSGKHMQTHQPLKLAAMEARWNPEQPGVQVWMAWPDVKNRRNLFAITTPYVGSWLATGDWNAPMQGLSDFPQNDWPPILIPFFSFRLMVGLGLAMMGLSALGLVLAKLKRLESARWYLWLAVLASPAGFAAVILGWFVSEVGRQPWAVYGLIRTAEAVTPSVTGGTVLATLIGYAIVYTLLLVFGCVYGYGILSRGPVDPGATTEAKE